MSTSFDDVHLSQLADGELGPDDASAALLDVLDDTQARERLKELLNLRRSLAAWRQLGPDPTSIAVPAAPHVRGNGRSMLRKVLTLSAAAMFGGLLVFSGVLVSHIGGNGTPDDPRPDHPTRAAVTAEQQRQVAQVFALHESVAGPLKWYAADAENIQLASARGAEATGRPIAVMLRLSSGQDAGDSKNYVIVCREKRPTTVRLPAYADNSRLRVFLIPRSQNGKVHVEYAVALERNGDEAKLAALVGRRDVALQDTALGQLVVDGRLVSVNANAWVIEKDAL